MWRPTEAEEALERCLAALRQGEAAEACVAAYPHLAGELAPLLATAQALLALAAETPDPTPALAHIRGRFLQRAECERQRR
jgi:hypothetical protein